VAQNLRAKKEIRDAAPICVASRPIDVLESETPVFPGRDLFGAVDVMAENLDGGGRRIRTIGPARERDGRGEGDPQPTIVVWRDPCLNDPIRLIGQASPFANIRDPCRKSGTDGSNPFPSSGESVRPRLAEDRLSGG